MDTGLQGKAVLITGASGGIGQATARAFAGEGARLGLHCHRHADAVERMAEELALETLPLQADLRDEAQTAAMFDAAIASLSRVDALVVNAGIWVAQATPLHEMGSGQWRATLDADLTSAFLTCRAFLRHLARQPREDASIVLVGSTAGLYGEEGHADYAAAKAAMAYGLTLTLKNEIVRLSTGGRVNCVCPGWVDTPMAAAAMADPTAVARATATMALPKIATPGDVAAAILFLTSPRLAGHLSGTILPVAGGMEGRLLHEIVPPPRGVPMS
jgi:3-oxoacyl-[acyl-carrier protein] reductase